ncbi:YicC/YloC family endoribonuclease [Salinithrix halophila]|uniref:YicC/YloC family endoribonuclease n=2 Tax=Salinithrix halophila TaxID=1485204 RepID=A0ABV8JC57_9BACL
MTGYGRGEAAMDGVRFIVEIKSINHRFQELVVRLPQGWMVMEEPVKKVVRPVVRRGRADIYVMVEGEGTVPRKLTLDRELAESIFQASEELKGRLGLSDSLSLGDLFRVPDVLKVEEAKPDPHSLERPLLEAVAKACEGLSDMRRREGQTLARDLVGRTEAILRHVEEVRHQAPESVSQHRERLRARMEEWFSRENLEDRLLAEAALFAEKADIQEELTRIESHASQFLQALHSTEPVGRRLDFLLQEMNREVNTIGSKANDAKIGSLVVECKSELEKMREQVQNIE